MCPVTTIQERITNFILSKRGRIFLKRKKEDWKIKFIFHEIRKETSSNLNPEKMEKLLSQLLSHLTNLYVPLYAIFDPKGRNKRWHDERHRWETRTKASLLSRTFSLWTRFGCVKRIDRRCRLFPERIEFILESRYRRSDLRNLPPTLWLITRTWNLYLHISQIPCNFMYVRNSEYVS